MKRGICHYLAGCMLLAAVMTMVPQEASAKGVGEPMTQQKTVLKGTVVDKDGVTLPGASVIIKGTAIGVTTDIDGRFELKCDKGNVLQISYVGMKTTEITVGDNLDVKVQLQDETIGLEQVVVVGYGTQKKATVTGSISQVGGEELKKTAAINLSNTLAGKTAGVIANTRSGEPGEDGATLFIRGKGTLGDCSPLIVVDGIADRSFSRLNPEDIESVTVLKDASAAIYGARAANGVILVTTKRGKDGAMQVNYSGNVAITQPTRVPDLLNAYEYANFDNEYRRKVGQQESYSEEDLRKYKDGSDPINHPDTDWWKEVSKKWATKTQHSLSFSGGTDKLSYYASASYLYQDAIYKHSAYNYEQYQFISNIDAKIGNRAKFSFDILGRQEVRNRGVYDTDDIFAWCMATSPGAAPYWDNGTFRKGYDGVGMNAALMVTDIPGHYKQKYNYLNLKPSLRLDLDFITKGLYVEGYAALDFSFRDGKTVSQPYDVYDYDGTTYVNHRDETGAISVSSWTDNSYTLTYNARLGYDRSFGSHKIGAFVAYEQSQYNFSSLSGYRTNFLSTAIPELFAGSDIPADKDNGSSSDETARQHVFGRINYGFADKYLLEFTLRVDGSMNFAKGKRWGTFPGVSAGWVMSEENFFEPAKSIVNFLKIKGSWGMMGNDNVAAYQYITQYGMSPSVIFGEENKPYKGSSITVVPNPDITWETAYTYNVGVSSQFLDGKFGLDVDWFLSQRRDILTWRNASIPSFTGLSLPAENIGKVDNSGFEIQATYQDSRKDFKWGATANFTYNKNEVKFMDEAPETPSYRKHEGRPIDGFVMYKALGIYKSQQEIDNTPHLDGTHVGDLQYADVNGDGKINDDDMIRSSISATPRIMYGLTLNGSWKGIDLNIFFQGQAKAKQMVLPGKNTIREFYDGRWSDSKTDAENAKAKYPRAMMNSTYLDTWCKTSTWWLRNAGFLRMKSVELGYTLPKGMLSAVGIKNLRVYVNGSNLFSWDKMKVCDPEVPEKSFGSGGGTGTTFYPPQRMLTFGLNMTF